MERLLVPNPSAQQQGGIPPQTGVREECLCTEKSMLDLLDALLLLPSDTVDTNYPENQTFQHTFDCLPNKTIGTYKVIELNHTANPPGAIMIWHKKKNITLVTDNGREDGKSCSLDHTLFFFLLDLRVTFAIQAMPWSLK